MNKLDSPFRAIDTVLADRISQWHQSDSELLWHTAVLTSFALQQGHTCLWPDQALQEAPYSEYDQYGGISLPDHTEDWLAQLQPFDLSPQSSSPLVLENGRFYLRRYWQFEQELASFFRRPAPASTAQSPERRQEIRTQLDQFFPDGGMQPDWQRVAAMNCLLDHTHVIIGGPGTGKTYTVTRILALLCAVSEAPVNIRLAAPTGKAAGRLAEAISEAKQNLNLDLLISSAIPDSAQTLHRLLGVIPGQLQFRHHRDNPIDADIVLVDEVSMVDLPMMARLTRAIAPHTRLILLGDADQLPSVAAGSVLADLVDKPHTGYSRARLQALTELDPKLTMSAADPARDFVTELKYSRRFSEDSGIGQLAKAVIAGNAPATHQVFQQYNDVDWLSGSEGEQALAGWIRHHYAPIAEQGSLQDALTRLKQFRILCATREGERGTESLNERISQTLNRQRQPFYHGQPVMVTQNHYGLRLFNGDIGLIWPHDDGHLYAWFEQEDGYRPVALGRLPGCETVYAMTIHKTQGSEFDTVAIILPETDHSLTTRELLYTGITRARRRCQVLGDPMVWNSGVTKAVTRWAGLGLKIRD